MANSHKSNIKDQTLNEKLYAHSHFKLLECREHKVHSNAICVIRDLIRQSNVHCSEQNMTVLGTEQFKTELYTEYAKLVDNQNQRGLLSVVNTDKNKIIFSQPDLQKEQFILDALIKFKNYLQNDSSAQNPGAKNVNLARTVISATGGVGRSIFSNKEQTNSKLNKMETYNGFSNKRLPKKIAFEDHYRKRACNNKKICVQPNVQHEKLSNEPEIGFVSASTMYRNPLKKACNTTNLPTYGAKSDSETSQASQLGNHDTLKHFDKKIVDIVLNEIMDFSPDVTWNDIAGLDFVKSTVQEIVIWPFQRPELFTGLRSPPRGILLFGPPGTGKTLIGKCIATESNSTFFCISASSLASKWVGESEQMVRVLFASARLNQPAVIFVDEIDSLLSQRSDKDQDFTRKLKTEFLVQFDGAKTNSEERVLVVGATNRPHELDEAARRRFVKRLYVPLPDRTARQQIILKLLIAHKHSLSDNDLHKICDETDGYSGSDVAHLCKEAAMGPIRSIGPENIKTISLDQVPPISLKDFINALKQVRASVVADDLNYYMEWNKKFGCTS